MLALLLVAACILLGTTAQLTLKNGMNQVGKIESFKSLVTPSNLFKMFTNPYVFAGLCLYGISSVLWLGALSQLNVSLIYPLLSTGYLLTAIGGAVLLGEIIPCTRWIGILLVISGVVFITR